MRKIWAMARNNLGLDEGILHALVKRRTGRESLKELTSNEAREVIDFMVGLAGGEESRTVNVPIGDGTKAIVTPMATKKQLWYIDRLAKDLGWDRIPDRLRGFLHKYAHVDDVRWLTREQAWRVTEGLKRMSKEARKRAQAQ
jgi:hypothetical protein